MSDYRILAGDVRQQLKTLPDESVHCVITSPPYWGLRDYGSCSCAQFRVREGATNDGGSPNYRTGRPDPDCPDCSGTGRLDHAASQLGLEPTPEQYVTGMVEVFREVRRVLRGDGTLWLNLGDSYAGSGKGAWDRDDIQKEVYVPGVTGAKVNNSTPGLKPKNLVGIPWRVAFALQADGWWLRSDIIWSKPNPMPESVRDRPTKAHEYLFLMSKSARYHYDADAIREADQGTDHPRHVLRRPEPSGGLLPSHNGLRTSTGRSGTGSNKRSVWTINTQPYPEAHFATFPEALVVPCVEAGSPIGGLVLDPFCGSGTVGVVCSKLGRDFIGIELNPDYAEMAERRIGNAPMSLFTVAS